MRLRAQCCCTLRRIRASHRPLSWRIGHYTHAQTTKGSRTVRISGLDSAACDPREDLRTVLVSLEGAWTLFTRVSGAVQTCAGRVPFQRRRSHDGFAVEGFHSFSCNDCGTEKMVLGIFLFLLCSGKPKKSNSNHVNN